MTLPDFHKNFPDEESCITYFKTQRLSNDLTCKSCGSKEFSFRNSKLRFYCLSCNKSFSLKSGTVMENSNLSFMTWLFCIKVSHRATTGCLFLKICYAIILLGFGCCNQVFFGVHIASIL